MAKKKNGNMIGSWSFLIGVILAVIFGFMTTTQILTNILIILGIIVGLLNIADEEVSPFLMAGTVLVIVSTLGQSVMSNINFFGAILENLTVLFVPATIIVALKHVFSLAKR